MEKTPNTPSQDTADNAVIELTISFNQLRVMYWSTKRQGIKPNVNNLNVGCTSLEFQEQIGKEREIALDQIFAKSIDPIR